MSVWVRLWAGVAAVVAVAGAYTVDDSAGLGRRFDGIGGLSGGGATSKLLINYAEPYRSEILDYLFKPNFGASLQILKVEIGGDGQSTDGTESSHMHESWDENYQRGYEWWLMVEAKKRNPDIKLYGLPWAFPGWVTNGSHDNPYHSPNLTAHYVVNWVQGALKYYNLTLDFIGVWNERKYDITYIKTLRATLDARGLQSVKLVAADGGWDISSDILKDQSFAKVVDYIGAHYPGTLSTKAALQTGKPLWSSEDYSTFNDDIGAGCWARILNQNYVNGHMTSTISWNLIASYYQALPFGRDGLMTAQEPWSGHYTVESPIWITAHTTQFTEIGWNYLSHGSGVGKFDQGGSYVSLVSPDKSHFTIVIETMSYKHSKCIRPFILPYTVKPQNVTFNLQGTMAAVQTLYLWGSRLEFSGKKDILFKYLSTIKVQAKAVSLQLGVDEMYTLTTIQRAPPKPYATPPTSASFPLPYVDDFNSYHEYSEAFNFVPQVGVWEVRDAPGSRRVNRQVALSPSCYWCDAGHMPINIGGNYNWTDTFMQLDVLVPSVNHTEGVFLASRVTRGGCDQKSAEGIFFFIHFMNSTFVVATDYMQNNIVTHGKLRTTLLLDHWYHLALIVRGTQAYGFLNVENIFEANIPAAPANGFAAYGATSVGLADYDDLKIENSQTMHVITN